MGEDAAGMQCQLTIAIADHLLAIHSQRDNASLRKDVTAMIPLIRAVAGIGTVLPFCVLLCCMAYAVLKFGLGTILMLSRSIVLSPTTVTGACGTSKVPLFLHIRPAICRPSRLAEAPRRLLYAPLRHDRAFVAGAGGNGFSLFFGMGGHALFVFRYRTELIGPSPSGGTVGGGTRHSSLLGS